MKLIRTGRKSPDWKREFECATCGAVLEVSKEDLFATQNPKISLHSYDFICFLCCECEKITRIGTEDQFFQKFPSYNTWVKRQLKKGREE